MRTLDNKNNVSAYKYSPEADTFNFPLFGSHQLQQRISVAELRKQLSKLVGKVISIPKTPFSRTEVATRVFSRGEIDFLRCCEV